MVKQFREIEVVIEKGEEKEVIKIPFTIEIAREINDIAMMIYQSGNIPLIPLVKDQDSVYTITRDFTRKFYEFDDATTSPDFPVLFFSLCLASYKGTESDLAKYVKSIQTLGEDMAKEIIAEAHHQ